VTDSKAKTLLLMVIGTWTTMASAVDFVHPGGINSKAELDFAKDRIKAVAQPWKGEFDQLKGSGSEKGTLYLFGKVECPLL
jgi:hypothetical protein